HRTSIIHGNSMHSSSRETLVRHIDNETATVVLEIPCTYIAFDLRKLGKWRIDNMPSREVSAVLIETMRNKQIRPLHPGGSRRGTEHNPFIVLSKLQRCFSPST